MKLLASFGWATAIVSAIGLLFGVFLLAVAVEALWGPYRRGRKYFKRRALSIRARELNRYSMGAFRGTRKSTWLS
jgi:hypothetical protein